MQGCDAAGPAGVLQNDDGVVSGCFRVGILLSNRSLIPVLALLCSVPAGVAATPSPARAQAAPAAAAPATPAAPPVCGLSGEIGESGRGRIVARGKDVGYRGELVVPLAAGPDVELTVTSDFAPHQPAVDRIVLTISGKAVAEGDAAPGAARLAGAFGSQDGERFVVGQRGAVPDAERAWFDELMGGATLTAAVGEEAAPVAYPARQFQSDYNYLLDLLQLVAGWEQAGLCVNKASD